MSVEENVLNRDILATVHSMNDIADKDTQLEEYGIFVKDILDFIEEVNDMDSIFSACYKYMLPFMSPSLPIQTHGLGLKIHAFIMALYNIRYLQAGNNVIRASHFLSGNFIELQSDSFSEYFNVKKNINGFTAYMANSFRYDSDEKKCIERNLEQENTGIDALYNLVRLASNTGSSLYIQDFLPILSCSSQRELFEQKIQKHSFPPNYRANRIRSSDFNRSFEKATMSHMETFNQTLIKCNRYYGEDNLVNRLLCYYKLEYVMKCDFLNDAFGYMQSCDREQIYEEILIACRLRNVLSRGMLLLEFTQTSYFHNQKGDSKNDSNSSKANIRELKYLADFFMPAFENVFLSVLMHIYDNDIDTIGEILTEYISQHMESAIQPKDSAKVQNTPEDSLLQQAWMTPLERILSPEERIVKSNPQNEHSTLERELAIYKHAQNDAFNPPKLHKSEQLQKLIKLLPDTACLAPGSLSYSDAALQLTDDQIIWHMLYTNVNLQLMQNNYRNIFSFSYEEYVIRGMNPFGIINGREFGRLCCAYRLFYSSAPDNSCANLLFYICPPKIWEHIKPCILHLINPACESGIMQHQAAIEKFLRARKFCTLSSLSSSPDFTKPNDRKALLQLCRECATLSNMKPPKIPCSSNI